VQLPEWLPKLKLIIDNFFYMWIHLLSACSTTFSVALLYFSALQS